MRLPHFCSFVFLLIAVPNTTLFADTDIFVSPTGNDHGSGDATAPLATIAEAQRRVRSLHESDNAELGTIRVHLASGRYHLNEPLEFNHQDSGTAVNPVAYIGSTSEPTVICGGLELDLSLLTACPNDPRLDSLPPSVRTNIRCLELRELGIEKIAELQRRMRHEGMHPTGTELFVGGQRGKLAGWPNSDWATIEAIDAAQKQWIVKGLRPSSELKHAWIHGFLANDWEDRFEKIAVIPHEANEIRILTPESQADELRLSARFRIENVLSELDAPNEYYLDREQLRLYGYSLDSQPGVAAYLSFLETPISLYDVEHLALVNLTIEGARVCGVEIAGGRNVSIENCTIRNIGNVGVNVFHGYQHKLIGSEIYNTGAGAIRVEGGDRKNLVSCEFLVENCWLHDFAELQLAYRPAINVYGVGTTIAKNRISNGPHAGIILHGNDHLVLANEVHHVCTQTGDVGAIYLAQDPTFRGNQIRGNYIHDLGGFSKSEVVGVYLDDFASGTTVAENIFERAGRGVAIGGGRDNIIENNLFVECLAAVQIDCRGTTWASRFFEGSPSAYAQLWDGVSAGVGIYAERYPELASALHDEPQIAKGNRIERNLFDGQIGIDLHDQLNGQVVQTKDNFGHAYQLVTRTASGRFELKPGTDAVAAGFRELALPAVRRRADTAQLVSENPPPEAVD